MSIGPRGTDGFEFKLGKLGLTLFVIGMVCLVFAAFQCGVIVGKDMEAYPEKAAEGLPNFIKHKIVTEKPVPPAASVPKATLPEDAPEQGDVDLTFYDTLGGKKQDPGMTPAAEATEKQPAPETVREQPKEQPVKAAVKKEETEKNKAPVKKENVEPAKAAAKKEEPDKPTAAAKKEGFVVQVVSMKDEKHAREISRQLKDGGYRTEVDATDVKGQKMFRVRIAGYPSRDEANKAASAIEKKSKYKCLVHEAR